MKSVNTTSSEALRFFYSHRALTEYLQTLTDEELNSAERSITITDIDNVGEGILDAIYQEREYRMDNSVILEEPLKRSK